MIGRICKSALFWFGLVYLVFGVIGLTSIRWVHALPERPALSPVAGRIDNVTLCGKSMEGRYAAIGLTTASGGATRLLIPEDRFPPMPRCTPAARRTQARRHGHGMGRALSNG